MKIAQKIKKITKVLKKNKSDRVYIYDEEVEALHQSKFLRVYAALGFIHLPKRQKYNPERHNLKSRPSSANPATFLNPATPRPVTSSPAPSFSTMIEEDCEEELEVITLEADLPPKTDEGDQDEPLPVVIAWEYPEEEMPVFLSIGYLHQGY